MVECLPLDHPPYWMQSCIALVYVCTQIDGYVQKVIFESAFVYLSIFQVNVTYKLHIDYEK